jgi:hypothetical protein
MPGPSSLLHASGSAGIPLVTGRAVRTLPLLAPAPPATSTGNGGAARDTTARLLGAAGLVLGGLSGSTGALGLRSRRRDIARPGQ